MKLQKILLCTLMIGMIGLSLPTDARADWRHGRDRDRGHYRGHNGNGAGLAVGLVGGLAVGAIIASSVNNSRTTYVRSYDYCPPARRVVVVQRAYPVERTVVVNNSNYGSAPYGYITDARTVRSPWSNFEVELGGKTAGQVVFDTNTGDAFRIP